MAGVVRQLHRLVHTDTILCPEHQTTAHQHKHTAASTRQTYHDCEWGVAKAR